MVVNFGAEESIEKAKKFLEDYHSTIDLVSADFTENTWMIVFNVGFLSDHFKQVKIDAETGKVMGYVDVSGN